MMEFFQLMCVFGPLFLGYYFIYWILMTYAKNTRRSNPNTDKVKAFYLLSQTICTCLIVCIVSIKIDKTPLDEMNRDMVFMAMCIGVLAAAIRAIQILFLYSQEDIRYSESAVGTKANFYLSIFSTTLIAIPILLHLWRY